MKTDKRKMALEKLEQIAKTEKEFWYRRICDYAFAYHLSMDDRVWLCNRLKEKNITILGMDPNAGPKKSPKKWYDEDGTAYTDHARSDYGAIYDEIVHTCEAMKPLVERIKRIKPPQLHEAEDLDRRIREGDDSARTRLLEMHLRGALAIGLKWSKELEVDLEDAIGDACEGLVKAAGIYNPDMHKNFLSLSMRWVYNSVLNGQPTHNLQITFKRENKEIFAKVYTLLRKQGCLGCDRIMDCDKALQQVSEEFQCEEKESRLIIRGAVDMLSLDSYLENAAHLGCAGQSEDICAEEDDAPDYEKELTGYCIDTVEEAERVLADRELRETLQKRLCQLTPREKKVLELRNGLGGIKEHTLAEIGCRYGVTRERIRQNERSALKKLKAMYRGEDHPKEKVTQSKDIKTKRPQTGKAHLKKEKPKVLLPDIKSTWRTNRKMKLWELLLNYRINHMLGRDKLAKLCGISEMTLARLEEPYSMYCPRGKVLLKIFENLEISEDEFMDVIKHDEKFRNMKLTWMWDQRNENRLLKYYHQMNRKGREIALAQMKALAELKKF